MDHEICPRSITEKFLVTRGRCYVIIEGPVLLAYFFVPLPEPLGLPDGFIFEFTRSLTYEETLELERKAHRTQEEIDAPILRASLRFWRATGATDELSSLFETARRALPMLPEPSNVSERRVPQDRTIVELAVPVSGDESKKVLSEAFDDGLKCLREFQRAYYLVGGHHAITLATRERLPFAVPVACRRVTQDADIWPDCLNLILLNANLQRGTRMPNLTDDQLTGISSAISGPGRRPAFAVYAEFVRESRLAAERAGDYRSAVVFSATAAEVLLDDLLGHLLWEDNVRPEEGAIVFDRNSLLGRVRSEYHPRLGGNWGPSSHPIEAWRRHIALVRNRIVHAGHEPDLEAARLAVEATSELGEFVTTRLVEESTIGRYPRTALKALGELELRRRKRFSKRIERLAHDSNEPNWDSTFGRWQAAVNGLRKEGNELLPAPGAPESVVVLVCRPDGRHYFAVHDRAAGAAGVIAEPQHLPSPYARHVAVALERLAVEPPAEETSLALMDLEPWMMPTDWRPQYRVLPLCGVMLNRQDIDGDLGG